MNTVNIRTVPINRMHKGGLVIMSKRKRRDTGKTKKDREKTGRRETNLDILQLKTQKEGRRVMMKKRP